MHCIYGMYHISSPTMHTEIASLIGSQDICRQAGIDRSTLMRHIKDGRIAPIGRLPGPNGAYVFDPADADAYIRDLAEDV